MSTAWSVESVRCAAPLRTRPGAGYRRRELKGASCVCGTSTVWLLVGVAMAHERTRQHARHHDSHSAVFQCFNCAPAAFAQHKSQGSNGLPRVARCAELSSRGSADAGGAHRVRWRESIAQDSTYTYPFRQNAGFGRFFGPPPTSRYFPVVGWWQAQSAGLPLPPCLIR